MVRGGIRRQETCAAELHQPSPVPIPYEDVATKPVVLEARPPRRDYIRPPIEEQEFVPEVHRKLL